MAAKFQGWTCMTTNKTQKALVPKLRFPEFRESLGWTTKAGNQIFSQISNKNHDSNLSVLAITQEHGAIPRNQINYHVSVSKESIDGYKVVEIGDFIISLRSFQGGIEYSKYQGLCSPAYIILRNRTGIMNDYFIHLFKTKHFIRDMAKNIEGLRDGKMVSYKQFSELMLPYPLAEKEQQKIAHCLSSIDKVIELEGQKLNALRDHKKGLLQNLFPAEGKTLPKFRFPEFRDSSKWIIKTLDENLIQRSQRNKESKYNRILSVNNTKGFILQSEQFVDKQVASNDLSPYKIVHKGWIAYNPSRINIGSIAILEQFEAGIVSPMYVVFEVQEDKINPYFLLYFVDTHTCNQKIKMACSGSVRDTLSFEALCNLEIALPRKKEQQKIAEFLSTADNMITAQEQKIASLKAHKKGLLQQLFPNPEEVAK